MSWYVTDDEFAAIDGAKKRADKGPSLRRFYLPAEKSNEITFVTDLPFVFKEHNLSLDGHWRNWFTCTQSDCPLCRMGNNAYLASAWLIIDHSVWQDRDGNTHQDELRLFVAKSRVGSRLKRIREKKGTLRGLRVEAFRSERMAANTGDQFTVEEAYSDSNLKKLGWWPTEDDENYNGTLRREVWAELFAPKDKADLTAIVSRIADEEDDEDAPVRF